MGVRPPLVRWQFAIALAVLGAAVAYVAVSALSEGRPSTRIGEVLALVAAGALPGSVIVATPVLGLGVLLLAFPRTRDSGVVLAVYAAAYLAGMLGGLALVAASGGLDR